MQFGFHFIDPYEIDPEELDRFRSESHPFHRVTPRSRLSPAILHVSKEAREEAKLVYELVNFDSAREETKPREIWFNSSRDIVYFGEDSCISTICQLASYPAIQRVAMNASGKLMSCCTMTGEVNPMQALHGYHDSQNPAEHHLKGYRNVKDIFFVVQSNLCRPQSLEINLSHGFRPATTDGMTRGQKAFKTARLAEIAALENGDALANVGTNQWTEGKMPAFHWVSLCPQPGYSGIFHDALGINDEAVIFLKKSGKTIENITKKAECCISIPNKSFPGEFPREIGFSGSRKGIEMAKDLIEKKLTESADGCVIPVST